MKTKKAIKSISLIVLISLTALIIEPLFNNTGVLGVEEQKIAEDIEELNSSNDSNNDSNLGINENNQDIISQIDKTREYLENNGIDSNILERLDDFKEKVELNSDIAEDIDNQDNDKENNQKIYNPRPFKTTEDGIIVKKNISEFDSRFNSEFGIGDIGKLSSETSSTSLDQYLSETEEIQFTEGIKDLADKLNNDPLNILNYVKNNIDYVPYYGLKKGADSTLIEKAGNDFDQSSLLIGLLRYSGYPARYVHTQVKLSLNQAMDLLGVEDPLVAAKLLSKTDIPYTLYTDSNDVPLFFLIERVWVETYISYDYTRGINQSLSDVDKEWVPMDPSLKSTYHSQIIDIIDEMNFNVSSFYENYLNGNYNNLKPIEAYKQEIETYLNNNHPDLIYEDILTKEYKHKENLEFIPNTLPYETVNIINQYQQVPDNLKHKIQFKMIKDSNNLLNYTVNLNRIANKQLVLTYIAATQSDQDVIDLYDSIYDIVPLNIVYIKPVIKVNGQIISQSNQSISLGEKQELIMKFLIPKKENNEIIQYENDIIEKETISGNNEVIAINTDRIVLPELRPIEDTQTSEYLSSQKLYRTAINYLDRLQKSHQELADTLGGEFTNSATRAIVFNGIDVNYQSGEPYSFAWKGLRIDSSAKVNYYSHFTNDIKRNQLRFLYLFGLEASLNESDIFEQDFNIESMSTVKGLRMINQGQIPDTATVRIDNNNINIIDTLNISEQTKNIFRTQASIGNIIYTSNKPITYQNFIGLVYINLNPNIGDGGYIIGEGLNGGYTVEEWSTGWSNFWRKNLPNLTANIITPINNQIFKQGEKIEWFVHYESTLLGDLFYGWIEEIDIETDPLPGNLIIGINTLRSGYGTNRSVDVMINRKPTLGGGEGDIDLGKGHTEFDDIIIEKADKYGIPPGILKAIIHKETENNLFVSETSRYEPKRDFQDFSGYDPNNNPPAPSRDINTPPFSYYKLPGINTRGQTIEKGSRVDSLSRDYKTTLKNTQNGGWQLREIIITDRNKDGILTVDELYENDIKDINGNERKGSQNWPAFGVNPPSYQGNFTPQFLISSSYGLGHVMYLEATEALDPQGNKIIKDRHTPHNIINNNELGIELAASILRNKFFELVLNDNCAGWSDAIFGYNPSNVYKKDVCNLYSSKYK